mmetsp:Transcript_8230/g.17068  ORF Transcript_8230/g.17068 Transcript_8230/m.17068 type:complete len:92 (-) Transcript_8230:370-645(-)
MLLPDAVNSLRPMTSGLFGLTTSAILRVSLFRYQTFHSKNFKVIDGPDAAGIGVGDGAGIKVVGVAGSGSEHDAKHRKNHLPPPFQFLTQS